MGVNNNHLPLAGVIGDPIAHSLSPMLFSYWLSANSLQGYYVPLHVSRETLQPAFKQIPNLGFRGINVTIPHKEKVIEFAHEISDSAHAIGAANTITFREDGTIHADNTDGIGFIKNIYQEAPEWCPSAGPAMILGAGGAARAIIWALLKEGVPEIFISNRTYSRAENLASQFGSKLKVIEWEDIHKFLYQTKTIINTTSLGMNGHPEMHFPFDKIKEESLVTDIVYRPLRTKFLQQAEARGAITVDGLGMLLHQAVPAFQRWFGVRPVVTEDLRSRILANIGV